MGRSRQSPGQFLESLFILFHLYPMLWGLNTYFQCFFEEFASAYKVKSASDMHKMRFGSTPSAFSSDSCGKE